MRKRPWYREPMLALVIGLPLAAVAGGIATFVIAERNADPGDPRVRRVAQTQTVDLAADREASRQGYAATATIDTDGVIRVEFEAARPAAASLRLVFRHVTDPRRDCDVTLSHVPEYGFAGLLSGALGAGAYNAELTPEDGEWRLVGRLEDGAIHTRLVPALGH
ncbi:MAG TPA: FixH family protein [Steroidobacteraceae bacterium]|nr:FixH family protein [Steroidobacteraceae bacterium]